MMLKKTCCPIRKRGNGREFLGLVRHCHGGYPLQLRRRGNATEQGQSSDIVEKDLSATAHFVKADTRKRHTAGFRRRDASLLIGLRTYRKAAEGDFEQKWPKP